MSLWGATEERKERLMNQFHQISVLLLLLVAVAAWGSLSRVVIVVDGRRKQGSLAGGNAHTPLAVEGRDSSLKGERGKLVSCCPL